jgi:hypothetical protein
MRVRPWGLPTIRLTRCASTPRLPSVPLSAAAEYNHSSQSPGRLRQRDHTALASRATTPTPCSAIVRRRQLPGDRSQPSVTRRPLDARPEGRSPTMSLTGHAVAAPRTEVRVPRTPRALLRAEPTEVCSTLAERGPPCTAWAEAHPVPAKPAPLAPRDRSRAARSAPASSHRAAETDTMLAGPTPSPRATEADTMLTEPDPSPLANRSPRPHIRTGAGEALSPGLPGPHTTCSICGPDRSRARSSLPRRLEAVCSHSRPDEATRRAVLDALVHA